MLFFQSSNSKIFQSRFTQYMISHLEVFVSLVSTKAECGLSSLSCVWMYVDQNQGTPPPELAYPLGIP